MPKTTNKLFSYSWHKGTELRYLAILIVASLIFLYPSSGMAQQEVKVEQSKGKRMTDAEVSAASREMHQNIQTKKTKRRMKRNAKRADRNRRNKGPRKRDEWFRKR